MPFTVFALHCPLFRTKLISICLWEFYGGNYFFDCPPLQFIYSFFLSHPSFNHPFFLFLFPLSSIPLFTACSGWQHMGSGDCPIPHAGRVHYLLFVWSELSPKRGPWALQRLYAATRLQSPEWRVLTRFALSSLFFLNIVIIINIMKKSWMCLLDPCALQAHGHELHVGPIYGDMKQPTVNRDSRLGAHLWPWPSYASSYASHVSW